MAATLVALVAVVSAAQPPAPPSGAPTIVIGGGQTRFAIPECVPKRADDPSRETCRTLTQVLRNDLKFEDLFQFVPEANMAAIRALDPERPNFADWGSIGATNLVVIKADVAGAETTVEVRLYQVSTGQTMLARRYTGRSDNPRVFAHQASDDIVALAQYKGVARSRIAFVSDRDAAKDKRCKELYIADYDGFNPRRVTVNRSLNIVPSWSPDGRSLAYVSYRSGSPDVYLASIYEGKGSNVTNGKGQSFAPAWSPDGRKLAYASNRSGNMEIWVSNADGSEARRLTSGVASDTAPAWSPSGLEIAFTSNRSGTPQIWLMDAETGLNLRRLTTVGNYNDAPNWNPGKEYFEVAYTSRLEGDFEIAVVDVGKGEVRQITQGLGSCEYPSWAPNGRHLVFSCSRGGQWQITVSDRQGRRVHPLAVGPGNNVQPDWGP